MKPTTNTFRKLVAVLLPMAAVGLSPLMAAPPVAPAADTKVPSQSVFVMPASPKEGRDPFFPNSFHPYQEAQAQSGAQPELSSLTAEGISRSGNRVFAVINGETFAVGDEDDVKTPTGKIHVRCIKINASSNSVVVEAGGQILILNLSNP